MPMRSYVRALALAWAATVLLRAGTADPLAQAYADLRDKNFPAAIAGFRQALKTNPKLANVHKDLAYTLLKVGENAQARDEFQAAMQLNAADEAAASEFAFLAFETGKPNEARRTFQKLRGSSNPQMRKTAEMAYHNIDGPLAAGIERWTEAIRRASDPNGLAMYSAHWELAQLAERRDEWTLAAKEYEICYRMKPQEGEVLLALARAWKGCDRGRDVNAALLAASRRPQTRTAELAREQFGDRYPYPYEFVDALKLDDHNIALRKELAYLYLAMHKEAEASEQFKRLLELDANDRESRGQLDAITSAGSGLKMRTALEEPHSGLAAATPTPSAKEMGSKSLALGYMRDAIRYLRAAQENDPDDAEILLKLGYAYNLAHDDASALKWFDLARHRGTGAVAEEARKAYSNLNGDSYPKTTVWMLPMFSSRWHDLFSYGQLKHELPLPWTVPHHWFSLYLSTRFMGDLRSGIRQREGYPVYYSENSFIPALGISTRTWHHLTGWMEAGEAISFLPNRHDVGAAIPDYRGGLSFAKGFGTLLGSSHSGVFYETTDDVQYVHRFDKDWLMTSQNRSGWTFHLGPATAQASFNLNLERDSKGESWANTAEFGPGLRLRLPFLPPNVYFTGDLLRGKYTKDTSRPDYNDVRVGLWFARSR